MIWFDRRFARMRMRLAAGLERSSDVHGAPEPRGRTAWLENARSVEDLWNGVRSPIWAVHLAYHIGRPTRVIMNAGTTIVSAALDGYIDDLPRMVDYGSLVPEERMLDSYFDWTDQPVEDLAEGQARYEKAAVEQISQIQARSARQGPASPYRESSQWPDDAAPRLHMLVAASHWFAAAHHASDLRPRKAPMCESMAVSLAHALAARPSRYDELLHRLVRSFRG